ncbi:HEAT repeat domain-containing protein [Streptomyces sp. NPDC047804]|uniref:HEAT repeat domain-containing protein n=1 Tax=Streptomyces atroolivaceus TaxID=66869 RepID=A0ABV9V1Z7_STRAZ|nr:HEAT repeat domain-containing protein [Streptomyces atroolivaceus]
MRSWENDPAYQAVERAFINADPFEQVGGPLDVRAVVADIRQGAKDGFLLEEVPWDRFPEGVRVREAMERLHSGDAAVVSALGTLIGLCANDMRAAVAPAVPFLIRMGTDPEGRHHAEALTVVGEVARMWHQGVCTRADMLRFHDDDEWFFEVTGYLQNWSVQAAREAIAADTDLLLPLLDDPDAAVRTATAYALAAASDRAQGILTAFRSRLLSEHNPAARAGLILAIAQLARAHQDQGAVAWMRACWSDPARPPEVRVSAALGWMCLTDLPVPDELRAMLDTLATDETARLMSPLPWMRAVETAKGSGLHSCLRTMLHPGTPGVEDCDDPWS